MDKKTILKIFGEAFVRSMIILMAVMIVGFGAFFILKVRSDKKQAAELAKNTTEESTLSDEEIQAMIEDETSEDTEEATTEEVTTEEVTTEATTEELDIPSTDKSILVLNSTKTNGLALKWMNKLQGAGFSNVNKGNYTASSETQTKIVVAEEGMGKDLLPYFNDAVIEVGTVSSGIDVSTSGVQIFIIIGSNDANVQ